MWVENDFICHLMEPFSKINQSNDVQVQKFVRICLYLFQIVTVTSRCWLTNAFSPIFIRSLVTVSWTALCVAHTVIEIKSMTFLPICQCSVWISFTNAICPIILPSLVAIPWTTFRIFCALVIIKLMAVLFLFLFFLWLYEQITIIPFLNCSNMCLVKSVNNSIE